jgi:pimeloyl-ACP methyl ester carboxylesterase
MEGQGYERAQGVIDVQTQDYFQKFRVPRRLMPDPQFDREEAQLHVHRVRPLYENDTRRSVPIVVLIHGRTVTGEVVFDLQDPAPGLNLSVQKALAWEGIDTFAPSLLGYGKSTRFEKGLDDPGNASLRPYDPPNSNYCPYYEGCDRTLIPGINPLNQQEDMLFVHPLAGQRRRHSSNSRFARTDVWVRDIDQVIDDALDRNKEDYGEGRDEVALLGYSLGGQRVGRALYADNPVVGDKVIKKVSRVVFLNSLFGGPTEEPDPFAPPTFPLTLNDRFKPPGSASDALWNMPAGSSEEECPGRIIRDIKLMVWDQTMEHEILGREWGGDDPNSPSTGLNRSPTFSGYGWNHDVAGKMRANTPTLVIQGLKDGALPTAPIGFGPRTGQEIYKALPASMTNKVLVEIECASHVLQWEGAASWAGPHYMLKKALIDWIKEGTFNDERKGSFIVDKSGAVKPGPATAI